MKWIFCVVKPSICIQELDAEPIATVVSQGELFTELCINESDVVFYDLFANKSGEIAAIELHAETDSVVFQALFGDSGTLQNVEFSPYPIIWLGHRSDGLPMGLEAFGDLKLFKSNAGKVKISFCPSNWINLASSNASD